MCQKKTIMNRVGNDVFSMIMKCLDLKSLYTLSHTTCWQFLRKRMEWDRLMGEKCNNYKLDFLNIEYPKYKFRTHLLTNLYNLMKDVTLQNFTLTSVNKFDWTSGLGESVYASDLGHQRQSFISAENDILSNNLGIETSLEFSLIVNIRTDIKIDLHALPYIQSIGKNPIKVSLNTYEDKYIQNQGEEIIVFYFLENDCKLYCSSAKNYQSTLTSCGGYRFIQETPELESPFGDNDQFNNMIRQLPSIYALVYLYKARNQGT